MKVSTAVAEFLSAKVHLSAYTRRSYRQRLGMFATWCAEHNLVLERLTARSIRAFLQDVSKRHGPHGAPIQNSTLRVYGTAVKTFVTWAARESEDLDAAISPTIAARVGTIPVETKVIQVFTSSQIAALFAAAEHGTFAARDKALLAVLVDTGARVSEVIGLTLDCMWLEADDSYILIKGKGRKQREVPLGRVARLALRRYITRYRKPAHKAEPHVFLAQGGRPITVSGLSQLIVHLGQKAGITGVRCSPHTFRHTFATRYLLDGNGDIYKLSRLMGHGSVRVTEQYARSISARQARLGSYSMLDHLKEGL